MSLAISNNMITKEPRWCCWSYIEGNRKHPRYKAYYGNIFVNPLFCVKLDCRYNKRGKCRRNIVPKPINNAKPILKTNIQIAQLIEAVGKHTTGNSNSSNKKGLIIEFDKIARTLIKKNVVEGYYWLDMHEVTKSDMAQQIIDIRKKSKTNNNSFDFEYSIDEIRKSITGKG